MDTVRSVTLLCAVLALAVPLLSGCGAPNAQPSDPKDLLIWAMRRYANLASAKLTCRKETPRAMGSQFEYLIVYQRPNRWHITTPGALRGGSCSSDGVWCIEDQTLMGIGVERSKDDYKRAPALMALYREGFLESPELFYSPLYVFFAGPSLMKEIARDGSEIQEIDTRRVKGVSCRVLQTESEQFGEMRIAIDAESGWIRLIEFELRRQGPHSESVHRITEEYMRFEPNAPIPEGYFRRMVGSPDDIKQR